jgi:hypothetical protein
VDGKPSNNAIVNYYLSNSNGSVVLSGVAKPSSSSPTNNSNPTTANNAGIFTIDLSSKDTAKLSTGPSILKIFANSLQAYKPYILTKTIIAVKRQTTSLG